jgi:hypothetical protein
MSRRGQSSSSSPVTAAAYDHRHQAPSLVAVSEDVAEAEHQSSPVSEVSASVCAAEMESLVALVGALTVASPCGCDDVNRSACSLLKCDLSSSL